MLHVTRSDARIYLSLFDGVTSNKIHVEWVRGMCWWSDASGSNYSFTYSTRSWAAAVVELAHKVFAGDAALAATGLAALADVCSEWSGQDEEGAPPFYNLESQA